MTINYKGFTFITLAMAVLPLVGFLLTFWFYQQKSDWVDNARRGQGIVIENLEKSGSNGTTFSPIVEYMTAEGQTQKYYSRTSSYPPIYEIGDKVILLFDPLDEKDIIIDHWQEKYLIHGIFMLTCALPALLLLCSSSIFFYLHIRNKRKKKLEYAEQNLNAQENSTESKT